MNNKIFSTRLKEALNNRNIRATDLVEKCQCLCSKYDIKIEKPHVSNWLSGNYEPSALRLMIISDVLNVKPMWLIGYEQRKEK